MKDHGNKVCKLSKAIYGLRQASRAWNKKFNQELRRMNFIKSDSEPCVYTFKKDECTLALYIDDFLES